MHLRNEVEHDQLSVRRPIACPPRLSSAHWSTLNAAVNPTQVKQTKLSRQPGMELGYSISGCGHFDFRPRRGQRDDMSNNTGVSEHEETMVLF